MNEELKQFLASLQAATAKFADSEKTILSLQQKVDSLSKELIELSQKSPMDSQKGYGFHDATTAKNFVDFVRGVYAGNVKDLVSTINITTDAEGGYTVPVEFRYVLLRLIEKFGIARNLCTVLPMKHTEMTFPRLTAGLQVYWIGEGQTIPKTQPTFGELRLVAKKMACMVPFTGEMIDDSIIEVANLVATLFAEAIAKEEDRVILVGKLADAPWDGVLHDPLVTNVSMAAGKTSFANVDADILADVISSMTNVQIEGARFYFHRTIFNVLRKLKTTTGEYIYSAPQGNDPATIWGYNFTLTDTMPSIADSGVNKPFIIFGNLKHVYLGDKRQMTIATSQHVGFAEDKIFMRVIQREGMAIAFPEALRVLKTAAA